MSEFLRVKFNSNACTFCQNDIESQKWLITKNVVPTFENVRFDVFMQN